MVNLVNALFGVGALGAPLLAELSSHYSGGSTLAAYPATAALTALSGLIFLLLPSPPTPKALAAATAAAAAAAAAAGDADDGGDGGDGFGDANPDSSRGEGALETPLLAALENGQQRVGSADGGGGGGSSSKRVEAVDSNPWRLDGPLGSVLVPVSGVLAGW